MQGANVLPRLLTELRSLAPAGDTSEIDELERRLSQQVLRVLVAGEAKRGKSTLLNAMLGRDVLPTGVVPVTAVPTTLRFGEVEQVVVRFRSETVSALPLSVLTDLVTERGNPANERGVCDVDVQLPLDLLHGMELVDTPGVGSVHAHNTAEAEVALERMDAAIVVLTADPPISASERAFLQHVREHAVRVLLVLNKIDRLDAREYAEAAAFTRQIVAAELGADVPVFPLSARRALEEPERDEGFGVFRRAFGEYVRNAGGEDLHRSVATRAARLARGVADTQQAMLGALAVSEEDLSDRLQRFQLAEATVQQHRAETAAVADAAFRRMQADTDQQAADLAQLIRPVLLREVAERVGAATGSAAAMEADVLGFAARRIREVVDDWRIARAGELATEVRTLDRRLSARLTDQIAAVRDAARQLFAVPMPSLPAPAELAPPGRFSYSFAPDPGQAELLATAIRTRLPVRLARRRIAAHTADRATELLDKHIGRCTAAFRQQLTDTRQTFRREVDHRFAEGAGRIAQTIAAAGELRATQGPRVAAARETAEANLGRAGELATVFEGLARSPVAAPERRHHRGATTP